MTNIKTITSEIEVNASNAKVWDALYTNYGNIHLFNPNLDGSHFTSGDVGSVGCERECQIDSKTFVRERITKAVDQKNFTIQIFDGNMPMVDTVEVDFILTSINPNKTRVSYVARFSTKPSFMAGLMKMPFNKKFKDILIGLKYHLETGKTISKSTYKPVYKRFKQLQPQQSF